MNYGLRNLIISLMNKEIGPNRMNSELLNMRFILGDDGIAVELNLIQNLGKSIYEYFKTQHGDNIVRQDVVSSKLALGDRSMVVIDPKSIYLFETNTGSLIYKYGRKKYQEEDMPKAVN